MEAMEEELKVLKSWPKKRNLDIDLEDTSQISQILSGYTSYEANLSIFFASVTTEGDKVLDVFPAAIIPCFRKIIDNQTSANIYGPWNHMFNDARDKADESPHFLARAQNTMFSPNQALLHSFYKGELVRSQQSSSRL